MDSTTLQEQLLQLAALVLAMGAAWLMKLLRDFLKAQGLVVDGKLNEQARDRLYPALQYAVAFGQAKLTADEQAALATSAQLKTHVVGLAVGYVREKMGPTLDELGVTDAALDEMLRARLQTALEWAKVPPAK